MKGFNMKKILITFILLVLAGCQTQEEFIPILVYFGEDAYISIFEEKLYHHGQDFRLKTYDALNSQVIQNELIDDLLRENPPSMMLVNLVDRLSAHALIEKAKETNTKLIFFNREPLSEDMDLYEHTYYVGANAVQSAQLQASLVMDLFGNEPDNLNAMDKNDDNVIQLLILKGQQGHQDAEQRTKYVVDELNVHGYRVEVLDILIANFDESQGYQQTLQAIDKHSGNIEVIISNNDAMALGAVSALIDKGVIVDENQDGILDRSVEPWVPVVGIDGLDKATELIETGFMYGTVENDADEMAKAVITLAKYIESGRHFSSFPYVIEFERYIWIDYNKLSNNQ